MTILLVDDERPAIQALQSAVNWQEAGFDKTEIAYDAAQAQEILEKNEIAVMLCDIEMPGNSGLELLQWTKAHRPDTVSILFTCHAEFDYAQKAVALGAFDYILKPAAMNIVKKTAARAANEYQSRREAERTEGKWESNKDAVQERFWLETVMGELPESEEKLLKMAARRGVVLDLENKYILAVCSIRKWNSALLNWNAVDLDYAFKNMLTELFEYSVRPIVISDSPRQKIILLPSPPRVEQEDIIKSCNAFFSVIEKYFKISACFYIAREAKLESLAEMYRELAETQRQNISYNNKVFFNAQPLSNTAQMPDMRQWQQLLEKGKENELYINIHKWLDNAVKNGLLNAKTLELFYHDFLQMLYTVLAQSNISAAQLLNECEQNAAKAMSSVEEMDEHLKEMLSLSCKYLNSVLQENTLIETVIAYIDEHLSDDLSRDLLAKTVYLNPNYLSRLFHRETGKSLVDYITSRRISRVKALLRTTNMSVTQAAGELGYTNMPYFSKVFKKEEGCTPIEYRRSLKADR